ncbi:hypothetical protein COV19_06400 [Candidatus Woesearchaeota archaeon CG10_big_fil_rev_8_21_14_0_10_44_13]|nr:MAG: hypothetical protein COV19_06400 [Candidatus Woesearchaeota archaeon CG10_big_fil_rev_8_21_14_0_10_44_13]
MDRDRGGFRGRGGFGTSFAPVKVGDELDVKIEAVGEKGDGIAKKNGFVLFVPGTKEGQEVRIRITKVLRKVGFAEVVGESSGEAKSEEAEQQQPEDSENFGDESEAPKPEQGEQEEPSEEEDFGEEESG